MSAPAVACCFRCPGWVCRSAQFMAAVPPRGRGPGRRGPCAPPPHGTGLPEVQNFLLVTSSLLIEAFPFILLGAVVGAFIETFVSPRLFERGASLPRPLQLPLAGLGGFAFPVCECGSVPVARRLILKGLSPHAGITFMLAVPPFSIRSSCGRRPLPTAVRAWCGWWWGVVSWGSWSQWPSDG